MQNKSTQEDDQEIKEFIKALEPLTKAAVEAFRDHMREDGIRRILAKSKNQK